MTELELIQSVEVRVGKLEEGHRSLVNKMDQNTQITTAIKDDTADIVEFTLAIKGLVTICSYAGAFLKWAAVIAGSIGGAWVAFKGWKT